MMLGDMLDAARASSGNFQAWLAATDPELAAKVAGTAAREQLGAASWVRSAVADFTAHADEEDWATLISAIRDQEDAGTVCLVAMVNWRLDVPDCGCHASQRMPERRVG